MPIIALLTDQGVRKHERAKEHVDYSREDDGVAYLFAPFQATHVVLDAEHLTVMNNDEVRWKISRTQIPEDWMISLMQRSTVEFVESSETDPVRAIKTVKGGTDSDPLPLKIGIRHNVDIEQMGRQLALTIKEFQAPALQDISAHRHHNPNHVTLANLVHWGLSSYLPQKLEVYRSQKDQYLHLNSKCAESYRSETASIKESIQFACPVCGVGRDTNLIEFAEHNKYHPLAVVTTSLAPLFVRLGILDKPYNALYLIQYENMVNRAIDSYKMEDYQGLIWNLLTHTRYTTHQSVFGQANMHLYPTIVQNIRQDIPQSNFDLDGPMCIVHMRTEKGFPSQELLQMLLAFYGYIDSPRGRDIFSFMPSGIARALLLLPGIKMEVVDRMWPGEDYTALQSLGNASRDTYESPGKVMQKLRYDAGLYHPYKPFGYQSRVKGGVI